MTSNVSEPVSPKLQNRKGEKPPPPDLMMMIGRFGHCAIISAGREGGWAGDLQMRLNSCLNFDTEGMELVKVPRERQNATKTPRDALKWGGLRGHFQGRFIMFGLLLEWIRSFVRSSVRSDGIELRDVCDVVGDARVVEKSERMDCVDCVDPGVEVSRYVKMRHEIGKLWKCWKIPAMKQHVEEDDYLGSDRMTLSTFRKCHWPDL